MNIEQEYIYLQQMQRQGKTVEQRLNEVMAVMQKEMADKSNN